MIDSKTISKVIQGDPQAFEKVYMQTHDKAYSIAYRVLKDDYEAEDIVQEAYIKMIEQVSQLEKPEKLESWFYRIVQNKALDYLRTSHSDTFSSFENEESDFSFSDTLVSDYTPFDPEASADYAELQRIMNGFVMELPEMQRKCILLRFKGDKKISEIAQILGIPESTVKSNLNYGKKKIEGEVRALEKQGVKLYSLSPLTVIAFLRWMWGKSAISAFSAGIGSAGAATAATAAVSGAAGGTSSASAAAGSAAAGTAAKTGVAIGTKQIIAGVCAAAVIGGGAAGILLHQPEKQLEKIVTVQSEAIIEEFVPHSYCLPQISDSEHDWSELNDYFQLSYEEWANTWDYHLGHQEDYIQKYSGTWDGNTNLFKEVTEGKHPEYTDLRFVISLAPPFMLVESDKAYVSAAGSYLEYLEATQPFPTREQVIEQMKFTPVEHAYCIDTGKPATHEDMMRYLGLSKEEYLQMLHDGIDEGKKEEIDFINSPDFPAEVREIELQRLEARRAAAHSLIASDTFSWNYPEIRIVGDHFILRLYDDSVFEELVSKRTGSYQPKNFEEASGISIYISFGKTEITEYGYYEYGKTQITTDSSQKSRFFLN